MDKQPDLDLKQVIGAAQKSNQLWLTSERLKIKPYDTDAWEFFHFVEQDLADDSERGRINALTNAKRAVECRVDELLTLLNLKYFSDSKRWGLPYKMQVLKQFDISAPEILLVDIASKRNSLEHKYVKPKQDQIKHITDLIELFLKATDKYIDSGYISSATITCMYIEDIDTGHWEELSETFERRLDIADQYKIDFDLKTEKLVLTCQQVNIETRRHKTTGTLRSSDKWRKLIGEPLSNIIVFHDCDQNDIKELMQIIVNVK